MLERVLFMQCAYSVPKFLACLDIF
jgi:hypothetical protein